MRVSCDLALINYTAFLLIIINKVIDVIQYICLLPGKVSNKICIYIALKTQKRSLPHAAVLKLNKNNNLLSIYPLFK